MALTLAALKTELLTDPVGYGYAAFIAASEPENCAAALNKARLGNDGFPAVTVRRADISSQEIVEAIVVADYTALPGSPTAAQLSAERRYLAWLGNLAAVGTVRLLNNDGSDGPVITNLKAMFNGGTGTITRLNAIANRNGSRAEQLWGAGVVVSTQDVAAALALP